MHKAKHQLLSAIRQNSGEQDVLVFVTLVCHKVVAYNNAFIMWWNLCQ